MSDTLQQVDLKDAEGECPLIREGGRKGGGGGGERGRKEGGDGRGRKEGGGGRGEGGRGEGEERGRGRSFIMCFRKI